MADQGAPDEPLRVSILAQGPYLIASVHTALDDGQLVRFQRDLIERIGTRRARGVVIDVAALDVLDSFGSRTLRDIARMSRLRGAETVIVGIAPELAISMVRLGLRQEQCHGRGGPRNAHMTMHEQVPHTSGIGQNSAAELQDLRHMLRRPTPPP